VTIAYAQSGAFVEFLRRRSGSLPFGVLIDRVRAGDPFETAFGVAFHSSLSVEERAFRADLERRYPWRPLLLSSGWLVWALTSILMLAAALVRRRAASRRRLEAIRVERLEDLGERLADAGDHPANDDLEAPGGPGFFFPGAMWIIHSIRIAQPRPKRTESGVSRSADARHR